MCQAHAACRATLGTLDWALGMIMLCRPWVGVLVLVLVLVVMVVEVEPDMVTR